MLPHIRGRGGSTEKGGGSVQGAYRKGKQSADTAGTGRNPPWIRSGRNGTGILNTKGGIERNGLFPVLEAKVFGREFDSISGFIGFHVDLQAFGLGIVC